MKLGIMQPYFFPYVAYFSLIYETDLWIVFDDIQYIRHGWINRNRIIHPDPKKEWIYILIPIRSHPRNAHISDIRIANESNWKEKIIGQLQYYKKNAPYYEDILSLIKQCFDFQTDSITYFNVNSLKIICEYLDIQFNHQHFDKKTIDYKSIRRPGDWALKISIQYGADVYINPIGGSDLFDNTNFDKQGIDLKFLKMNDIQYDQKRNNFIPNLSIIDLLMFNSKEKTKKIIQSYTLV